MTNWQFITIIGTFVLSVFGFILTVFGAIRSLQSSINEQLTAFRNEMRAEMQVVRNDIGQNDKRYIERFNRIETDIAEIKTDIRRIFKPILPG